MQMTFLLTTAICWLAATSLVSAEVYRTQDADGVSLSMIGNVEWSDQTGAPYRKQPVVSLKVNNADLTKTDVEEIAAFPALEYLELGTLPEGVTLVDADLSPLRNLKALTGLGLCIENPASLRLDFVRFLRKLETLEIWRHLEPGEYPPTRVRGRFVLDQAEAETIGRLPNLQTLRLSYLDKLDDTSISLVTKSGGLEKLELAALEMIDVSLNSIAANKGLTKLGLIAPRVSDEVGEMAARLQKLTRLSIWSGKTSAKALKGISKLRDLESFSLRIPNATPEDFALLRAMTRLEWVTLDDCVVTEEAIRQLAGRPNLTHVYLPAAEDSPAARELIMNLPRIEGAQLGPWKFTPGK